MKKTIIKYLIWAVGVFLLLFIIKELNPLFYISNQSIRQSENFTVISHRGAAGLAPGNTMSAIDSAIVHNATFIEIDVQQTQDGVVVLLHDESLDRTTNRTGAIIGKQWNEIKEVDAGSHFSEAFANEKIPTLSQALERIKQSTSTLVIEVKNPEIYPGIGKSIIDLIKATNTIQQTVVISFDVDFILELKTLNPNIKMGCLYILPPKPTSKELSVIDYVSIHYLSGTFCKRRIKKIQKQGIKVWAWTVNSPRVIDKLKEEGFDGITTDYPNLFEGIKNY